MNNSTDYKWYVVEVLIDGRYWGKYLTFEECEEDARDTIANSDIGANHNYDEITLYSYEYEGADVSMYDESKFYSLDDE